LGRHVKKPLHQSRSQVWENRKFGDAELGGRGRPPQQTKSNEAQNSKCVFKDAQTSKKKKKEQRGEKGLRKDRQAQKHSVGYSEWKREMKS